MGTITMSGFNKIDFNAILEAVMQQERQPLTTMESRYTVLQQQSTAYATLASKLSTLESRALDLSSAASFTARSATSTDSTVVAVSADSSAMIGTYDVVVTALARAQVTTTSSTHASRDTVVATGGSLTINGEVVSLTGETTLEELADAINENDDTNVKATVVAADGQYRLVLTGTQTGAANSFTIENNLEGSTVVFSATNAVDAQDADVTINNVRVTNSTNAITDAIPGATLTLLKESASPTVVSVTQDTDAAKSKIELFVLAFNDLVKFFDTQAAALKNGEQGNLGADPLARSLRREMASVVLQSVSVGGSLANLAEIGIGFERSGQLSFDASMFDEHAEENMADIEKLLAGTSSADGVFDGIKAAINNYTTAGGLVPSARERLTEQMTSLNDRMAAMEERLAIRQLALQREYAAADQIMATLNAQTGTISNLGGGYRLY